MEDGAPGVVNGLWRRRQNTMFNGASNIVQGGALAVFYGGGKGGVRRDGRPIIWPTPRASVSGWKGWD